MPTTTGSRESMKPPVAAGHHDIATKRLPLYLLEGVSRHVDLDGPALRLRQDRAPDLRYPLARLSRILTGQGIQWSSTALCACMEARIPIVFLGKDKRPLGYLLPTLTHRSRLDDTLQEYVSLNQWEAGYENWLRAERMRILREWCAQRLLHGYEVTESKYQELVHTYIYRKGTCLASMAPIYYSAITTLVADMLVRSGVNVRYQDIGGGTLELLRDIADLMDMTVRLEIHGMGDSIYGSDAALLNILHMFGETLHDHCLGILQRLHKTFAERLEQWH